MVFILSLSMLIQPFSSRTETHLIKPPWLEMKIPEKGFVSLDDQDSGGECDTSVSYKWQRASLETFNLFVHVRGPAGSGRYWVVTVGAAGQQEGKPDRGFCLTATTLGWRTLQQYERSPLPWMEDLDNDKKPEFIIWDSFPG